MNAATLYAIPERHDVRRWALGALVVVALHSGVLAGLASWNASQLAPGATIPAVLVDLSPVSAAPQPQEQDLAPGPTMQQAEAPAQETAPQQIEATIAPTPPQRDPVVAAPPEPATSRPSPVPATSKPVRDVKKHSQRPPAPKTTAPPRAERQAPVQNAAASGEASAAATASYRALLSAHLQRFKQYPAASRASGETGVVTLSFTVNRSGQVLSSRIGRSSGHPALDAETMTLIRRAQPLPAFPPDMHQASMSFNVPIAYALR